MKDKTAADAYCASSEQTSRIYGHRNVKHVCVTCESDGCNGAAQYGPIALSIALPATLLAILLHSL